MKKKGPVARGQGPVIQSLTAVWILLAPEPWMAVSALLASGPWPLALAL